MKRAIANLVDNAAEAVQASAVKEIEIYSARAGSRPGRGSCLPLDPYVLLAFHARPDSRSMTTTCTTSSTTS